MKIFNTTAVCIPEKHYMVDLTSRLVQIKKMVDAGQYFMINRARQYGKTTTLKALGKYLADEYVVLSLDFQGIGAASFRTEETFVRAFCLLLLRLERAGVRIPEDVASDFEDFLSRKEDRAVLVDLFLSLSRWCGESPKPIVLMIDEVDSASNNQVFLDFLAQLRRDYIDRETIPTFQSVILAGVTDVKNLKRKLRPEEAHKFNSPWNIAADYKVDMSFHPDEIAGMLREYEKDHHFEINTDFVAQTIYDYTDGYPFLVSRICQVIDTDIQEKKNTVSCESVWSREGISEAVKRILAEKNTLFESLMGKLYDFPELNKMLRSILFAGKTISYSAFDSAVSDAEMYGFVKNENGSLRISNRIFETLLYNYYLSEEELRLKMIPVDETDKKQFIVDGQLNMDYILLRFVSGFGDIYGTDFEKFDEEEGRRRFLLYIRPIINGTGNYYIEAETRNRERMDLVIDYLGKRYVIELKLWRGKAYHEAGEKQLVDYLESYHLKKGYLLIYNFNKKKKTGLSSVSIEDKELIEAFV